MSLTELGQIMLEQAGSEACQSGYGTIEPDLVGEAALAYGDINADGSLN